MHSGDLIDSSFAFGLSNSSMIPLVNFEWSLFSGLSLIDSSSECSDSIDDTELDGSSWFCSKFDSELLTKRKKRKNE